MKKLQSFKDISDHVSRDFTPLSKPTQLVCVCINTSQIHALLTLIDALRRVNAVAETEIVRSQRGQPPTKRVKRCIIALQERLLKICRDRATGEMSVAEALSAAAHTIRYK